MKFKNTFFIIILLQIVLSFLGCKKNGFTENEKTIIGFTKDGIMPLKLTTNKIDSLFLRQQALPLNKKELKSDLFEILKHRMLLTVNDSTNQGVGIAASQVGIGRQLIAVQRFDKENEPFEFYINPNIIYYSEPKSEGREGCLSIPDISGIVLRSDTIKIKYDTFHNDIIESKEETITGFTAVIFQHETDHLHGIFFTDKMSNKVE